ncbi:unnamed protein product [Cylindrotheca closterium]|uniref:Uncharacterized protein n=1 Tax=Cylindrotheca closterium TaxID=2856 RepID=A0AAD2CLY6_9STRA|nr:unnamed protein product [Cylindrotheca closterium]
MKANITNPPEKDPNLITTVADQGQGGLEAKTRSNSTTQSSIALTKDNPAITTPKRSSKRYPSETAEDGAMKGSLLFPSEVAQGQDVPTVNTRPNPTTPSSIDLTKDNLPDPTTSKSQRKQPPPSKTAKDGAVQGQSLVAYINETQGVTVLQALQEGLETGGVCSHNRPMRPAIIPHIVEESERLKREPTIAKAQSKFKKRLESTPPEHPTGAKAHDSPKNLHPSNEPMKFVEIVWHALTTAFPTKQGWNQNELLSYLHTTTILLYDVCAAHQTWPPTMGSNDAKSHEMNLKSTRTAPEHAQEGLEATTRSNSTTLLTVDLVKDNPYEHKFSMLYSIFVLFLSLEKIQQTKFLVHHFQILTIRVGAPICPLTGLARENCIQFFPWKRYPQNSSVSQEKSFHLVCTSPPTVGAPICPLT